MGIGKWIGGVLGFMAFGPLGALAGIILGSFFEEGANMTGQSFGGGTNYDDEYTRRDPYAGERNSFLFSMLVMASYIIRADGKIMHSEMEYVRQFLRRNFGEIAVSQGEEILLKLFDQAKRMDQENNMGFKNTIRECGTQIAYNLSYEERLQLLAFLAEIAKSDGNVCAAEINALKVSGWADRIFSTLCANSSLYSSLVSLFCILPALSLTLRHIFGSIATPPLAIPAVSIHSCTGVIMSLC